MITRCVVTSEKYDIYGDYDERNRRYVALETPVRNRAIFNKIISKDGRFYRVMLNAWREPYLKDVTDDFTAVLYATSKGATGWHIGDTEFFAAVFGEALAEAA